jgi:hypothetical protein
VYDTYVHSDAPRPFLVRSAMLLHRIVKTCWPHGHIRARRLIRNLNGRVRGAGANTRHKIRTPLKAIGEYLRVAGRSQKETLLTFNLRKQRKMLEFPMDSMGVIESNLPELFPSHSKQGLTLKSSVSAVIHKSFLTADSSPAEAWRRSPIPRETPRPDTTRPNFSEAGR